MSENVAFGFKRFKHPVFLQLLHESVDEQVCLRQKLVVTVKARKKDELLVDWLLANGDDWEPEFKDAFGQETEVEFHIQETDE